MSQVEIQLGHLCNNRCVFCVSGLETSLGRARPMPVVPLVTEVERAHAAGHKRITLLGGEPTLQPGFLEVVSTAARLGFEEIVVFSNGVKTARAAFIDEVLATGGRITWRLSFQGATKDAHERTTRKPGSFDRLVRTLEALAARKQRITVNMCVVSSNYESVGDFATLLHPYGVSQLHLDMVRPLDAGERTERELRDMMPRYTEMVPALTRMVAAFPDGFDLNIGNFPYCVAPALAPWIHHDGEHTMTVAVDGDATLSEPWDKYETKRRDKLYGPDCDACIFRGRCNGVFETYAGFYGLSELRPVTPAALAAADPSQRLFELHLAPLFARIRDGAGVGIARAIATAPDAVTLSWQATAQHEPLVVTLRPRAHGGRQRSLLREANAPAALYDAFTLYKQSAPRDPAFALEAARALAALLAPLGPVHPVGDDLVVPLARSVAARLARLRRAAPHGELTLLEVVAARDGSRAEARFRSPTNELATVWLEERAGRPSGGYKVPEGVAPTEALVAGLRSVVRALGVATSGPRDSERGAGDEQEPRS
ncbi:MAG: radical SAM protein [Polyangiaceae bacterium]